MSKIPRADEMLYNALPKDSRKAVDGIAKLVKQRSRAGISNLRVKLSGGNFSYNAIVRLFTARGYDAALVDDNGTATILLDWRCFCCYKNH